MPRSLVRTLLVIGGVEQNPGPVVTLHDNLSSEEYEQVRC
jgi:hypothetical protein